MSKVYNFDIPQAPPSVNNIYRRGTKGVYLTQAARNWSAYAHWMIKGQIMAGTRKYPLFSGPVSISVQLWPRRRGRNDMDNAFKISLDALETMQVFADDSQVVAISARKFPYSPLWKQGRITIHVQEFSDPESVEQAPGAGNDQR